MDPTATELSSTAIVEVREETMIAPVGGDAIPMRRAAHFLKPSLSSSKAMTFESPSPDLSLKPFRPAVSFPGWRDGKREWKLWVEKMAAIHRPKWEEAGIFDAVMNSVYEIKRDDDLVFGLAERWCSKTNTFVFQWGEATVTLEDMAVLGFSVLGSPIFLPVAESEELKELEQGLSMSMAEMLRSPAKKADVGTWVTKFRDSESLIEHEAFLVAWLSRYVFANTHNTIRKEAFSIAIHLARGTRIALAPAVLASIYRDLGILKRAIVVESRASSSNNSNCSILKLGSPFQLVQLWAWERFLQVQPQPNELSRGEPRLARWSIKKIEKRVGDTRMILDSTADDNFIWRPYTLPVRNWDFPKFYGDKERWVTLESSSGKDDHLVCLARCLRPSSLVGMDTSIQQYSPHRVAMQFGFDQGIPGCVSESNAITDDAWSDYSRALDGVSLYVPSRLFEADVTTLYHQWWKHAVVELRRGELPSLLKRDEVPKKKLMDKEEDKTGGGKLSLLKKGSKHVEKRSLITAADGSGTKDLLIQEISAMSYKNAKRKNDSDDELTDIERLVKRVRARAYRTRVEKDGCRIINISDPSAVLEAKVVSRNDDDVEEDRMTIAELVKTNFNIGFGGAAETVAAMIWGSEAAAESKQIDGYKNHVGQPSNHRLHSVAHDQTPGKGSGDVSSSQPQCHSFLAVENVVANPDRAATPTTNVMKMEPFEEVMKEVTAEAGVAEIEKKSNASAVSLFGSAMNLSSKNSGEVDGGSMFEPILKRLDSRLSELEKLLESSKELFGKLSAFC